MFLDNWNFITNQHVKQKKSPQIQTSMANFQASMANWNQSIWGKCAVIWGIGKELIIRYI